MSVDGRPVDPSAVVEITTPLSSADVTLQLTPPANEADPATRVVPLGSSVLAPGLEVAFNF